MVVAAPFWLVAALLAAGGLAWIAVRNGWGGRRAALAAAAALLSTAAPAGLALPSAAGPVRVVVVDDSGSMRNAAPEVVKTLAAPLASGGARVGVVRFAEVATVERTPSALPLALNAEPDRTAHRTEVAAALLRAAELLPAAGGEVVLVTDGRVPPGTLPEVAAAGRALRGRRGKLSVVPAGARAGEDAAALSLHGPSRISSNAAVRLHATIRLSSAGVARYRVMRDDIVVREGELAGRPGEQRRLVVDDSPGAPDGSTLRYRLTASAGATSTTPDALPQNGSRELLVTVGREAVVWVCSETALPDVAHDLARAAGVQLRHTTPRAMPAESGSLAGAHAVIVWTAQRDEFPAGALEALADYVEAGGGLLQMGGTRSFGLAGFGGDPLERVTAVKSDPRSERPLALAVVLDASGSMAEPVSADDPAAGAKIDAARGALEAALEELRPADRLYVVPFRDGPLTPIEFGAGAAATGAAALKDALIARGGTHLRPAIESAADWLQAAKEPARQLVIISDGRDPRLAAGGGDRDVTARLLATLQANAIGASVLTSARDDDLSTLIAGVGGRTALLLDFAGVERLLGRELRLSRGSLEWTGDARPEPVTPFAALPVPAIAARVRRANRTALNTGGVELLRLGGEESAPLLAVREAGLGRTAAFTSAASDGWALPWMQSGGASLLVSVLRWTVADDRSGDASLRAISVEDRTQVTLRWLGAAPADGRQFDLLDGTTRTPFRPSGPGRYTAPAAVGSRARVVRVVEVTPGGERPVGPLAIPGAWAAEWEAAGIDLEGCHRLAAAAGGTAVDDAVLWRPFPLPGEAPRPIGGWLLLIGLALLLALFGWRRR